MPPVVFSPTQWIRDNWFFVGIILSALAFVWNTAARATTLEDDVRLLKQQATQINKIHIEVVKIRQMLEDHLEVDR